MANHGDTERHILGLFKQNATFKFEDTDYAILKIGKPKPAKGECKTDIYILAVDAEGLEREFKISIKQSNADFLENKMSIDRAKEIFGTAASGIIEKSVEKIRTAFEEDFLINLSGHKRTEPNCIKIGWRFELLNKPGGEKSGLMLLSKEQKIDVYAGSNLSPEKRHSKVNLETIPNSGVANYIMTVNETNDHLDFYLDRMLEINAFAAQQDIYFVCKAVNYRVDRDKWDGNRPLAVYCKWFVDEEKLLNVEVVYNNPLETKANAIGNEIRSVLRKAGLSKHNFHEVQNLLSGNVRLHK